jgi:hypothetical protein
MPIYVKVAAANTGATTLTVGSLPAVSIKRADGTALHPGDLSSGLMIIVAYDGASYRMLAPTRDSAQLNGKSWVNKVNNLLVSAVANNSLHAISLNPGGQHNFYRYSVYGVAPGGAYVGTIHGYMTGTVPYVTLTQGSSGSNDTSTIWNNFGSSLDFYVTVDSWE